MKKKVTELDEVVLSFSAKKEDEWKLRDAVQGVQIFGSIGSGKSSGSGSFIARHFLSKGFGGIVLTGKKDEKEEWRKYAIAAGRTDDMIYFEEDAGYFFNPLVYEMDRTDKGGKRTENIATLFTSIVKLGNRLNGSGGGGGSDDPFWDMALQRCIKATLDLLKLSNESITVPNMVKLISGAVEDKGLGKKFKVYLEDKTLLGSMRKDNSFSHSEIKKVENSVHKTETDNTNYVFKCLIRACKILDIHSEEDFRPKTGDDKNRKDALRVYDITRQYFLQDFATLPEKTRGSILEMFYSFANPFRSGLLAEYFSANRNSPEIMPEETFRGKVIVINFSVKEYLQLGVFAQSIYKKVWQQAVERRDIKKYPTPVFLWIDEAQYFISEDDMLFQTTARSARACTVMITQNISNYYAMVGGRNAKERVDSLLGNLVTKIFHANNDYVTNEWAANTISKTKKEKDSSSIGTGATFSESKELDYQIYPQQFINLRNGGKGENKKKVDAIITSTKKWSTGTNYLKTSFTQPDDPEPKEKKGWWG